MLSESAWPPGGCSLACRRAQPVGVATGWVFAARRGAQPVGVATGWVFAGPPGDGPAEELGDPPGEVAEEVGVAPTLAEGDVGGADGVAVGVCVCAGVVCVLRPPTTPPTVVPPPCRCQTTAFSGFPTDNSNTVMAATATRNVPSGDSRHHQPARPGPSVPPPSLTSGVSAEAARDRLPVTAKVSVGESCIGSFRLMGFGEPVIGARHRVIGALHVEDFCFGGVRHASLPTAGDAHPVLRGGRVGPPDHGVRRRSGTDGIPPPPAAARACARGNAGTPRSRPCWRCCPRPRRRACSPRPGKRRRSHRSKWPARWRQPEYHSG